MTKVYRVVGKAETSRYKQLKEKLIELGVRNGEITSRSFAAFIGIFSESSARNKLALFEADGLITLVARRQGGQKVYILTNIDTTRTCDTNNEQHTTSKINLLNNRGSTA